MAIGDNVFQVRPNEGNGGAFILGENPALQHLLREDEVNKAREYEKQKELQDHLAKISSMSADALPIDQKELIGKYQGLLTDYKEQRHKGEKFKNGSDAQIDLMGKMAGLQAEAAKAKMYKDLYVDTTKEYSSDVHEQESAAKRFKYLTETPLSQKDFQAIPALEKQFNKTAYLKSLEGVVKKKTDWFDKPNQISKQGDLIVTRGMESSDPESAANVIMTDRTKAGEKLRNTYFNDYLNLVKSDPNNPLVTNINKQIAKENVDAVNNPDLYKAAIVKQMAKDEWAALNPPSEKQKIMSVSDYANQQKAKNQVNVDVSKNNGQAIDPIFGVDLNGKPRQVTSMHISTPAKGENEQTTFTPKTGFVVDANGTKVTANLQGKPLKGSLLDINSSPNPNNPKQKEVYAVIESNALSNRELNPKKYRDLQDKVDKGEVLSANEEALLKDANDKQTLLYSVPLSEVAKDYQAELEHYNKLDIIKEIEGAHGIKFSDYIKRSTNSSAPKKTEVHTSKVAQLAKEAGYTEREYRKLLQAKGIKITE